MSSLSSLSMTIVVLSVNALLAVPSSSLCQHIVHSRQGLMSSVSLVDFSAQNRFYIALGPYQCTV